MSSVVYGMKDENKILARKVMWMKLTMKIDYNPSFSDNVL